MRALPTFRGLPILLALAIWGICPLVARAQRVTAAAAGIIVDQKNQPVTNFTVYLVKDEPTSVPRGPIQANGAFTDTSPVPLAERVINRAVTDSAGKFSIAVLAEGSYIIRGGSKQAGFVYVEFQVKNSGVLDLGKLKLVRP